MRIRAPRYAPRPPAARGVGYRSASELPEADPNVHGAPRQQPAHTRKQSLYHKGGWCQIGVRPSTLSHRMERGPDARYVPLRPRVGREPAGRRPRPRAGERARASSPCRPPPGEVASASPGTSGRATRRTLFAPVRPRRGHFAPLRRTGRALRCALRLCPLPSVAARLALAADGRGGALRCAPLRPLRPGEGLRGPRALRYAAGGEAGDEVALQEKEQDHRGRDIMMDRAANCDQECPRRTGRPSHAAPSAG